MVHQLCSMTKKFRYGQQAAACRIQIIEVFCAFVPDVYDACIFQNFQMMGYCCAGDVCAILNFAYTQAAFSAIFN